MKLKDGQVAVVTGAASGIGRALADAFVARGLRVVLADVQPESLASTEAAIAERGASVLAVPTDVTDLAQVERLFGATLDRFGRVDVICNNAGVVGPRAPSWEQDPRVWRWVLDVALMGVIHGIRAFVPHLVEQNSGYVLNTASVGGLRPLPGLAPYNAAKHAVIGLSETLSEEFRLADAHVGVSVLCPGRVTTALAQTSTANRPADVAVSRDASDGHNAAFGVMRTQRQVLEASAVAEIALEGIESEQLHIISHADSASFVRARVHRLLADIVAR